ncbi:DUF397 domain-containing protein [Streptomyces sp. NRRL S-1521]|uniref:DUF397 domain-containing protein n=1 Tax=Streptomyces sp. NRRL S-1521 TaxID=1609100 RepID=UPI000AF3CBE3
MSTASQWFESSGSTEQGRAGLETASARSADCIRGCKNPRGAHRTVTTATWAAFLALPQKPGA